MSEEVEITHPKHKSKTLDKKIYRVLLGIILITVVVGVGFYSGVAYQKNRSTNLTASNTNPNSPRGVGYGFGHRFSGNRTFGTVSAISATSITAQTRSGNSKTFSIDSSTVISDNGQTITAGNIQTGDTVFITTSSTTSALASRILVNPSFGSFGGSGSSPNSSSTNSGTSSQGPMPNTSLNFN